VFTPTDVHKKKKMTHPNNIRQLKINSNDVKPFKKLTLVADRFAATLLDANVSHRPLERIAHI
jgi:hypothetical protein